MKKSKQFKPIIAVFTVLLLWTCIIFCGKTIKEEPDIMEYFKTFIIQTGFNSVNLLSMNMESSNDNAVSGLIFDACPLIDYLIKNKNSLETTADDSADKIAKMYPGYSSRNACWSGAGNDMAVSCNIFGKSDIVLAGLEEDDDEAAVIAENEAARKTTEPAATSTPDKKATDKTSENNKDTNIKDTIASAGIKSNLAMINRLKKSKSRSYLLQKFYITDASTSIDNSIFNVEKLLNMSLTIKKEAKPQILIFHTHGGSEAFIDSRAGKIEDSIVGVGTYLSKILEKNYGYEVIHDMTQYDVINGKIDRNKAYNNAASKISETLNKYPSIKVVIDLHRDGVGNAVHRTTVINGKSTAQVMFFNGLSRNSSGNIAYLYNPNLQANLAFSLQMKLKCMEKYPDFAKPVYLKSYRYNMHLKKRFLLIELGNENNKLAEAKNAMQPLAEVLDSVLSGE